MCWYGRRRARYYTQVSISIQSKKNINTHNYVSAASSVTGNPFLSSRLDTWLNSEEQMKRIVSTLDELTSGNITPLTRVQYQLQRHWLMNPQENIADVLFIFACLPGMAAIPNPDGGMSLWLPLVHFVCRIASKLFSPLRSPSASY